MVIPLLVCTSTTRAAIVEYLEEAYPTPALLPSDAIGRCHVREICALIANDIQPLGNLRVLARLASHIEGEEAKASAKREWGKHFIALGFAALEVLLGRTAGVYCVGDSCTLADAFLVPQVYNAVRFKVDMTAFPIISRVNSALLEVPAVIAASPAQQPDAEKE